MSRRTDRGGLPVLNENGLDMPEISIRSWQNNLSRDVEDPVNRAAIKEIVDRFIVG